MPDSEQIVLTDYPVWAWAVGVLFIVLGALGMGEDLFETAVFVGSGLIAFEFGYILTVSIDRNAGALILRSRSILRRRRIVIGLDEIASVGVNEYDGDEGGPPMYRVVIRLRSGRRIPMRNGYSSWKDAHEEKARKIRAAMGLARG